MAIAVGSKSTNTGSAGDVTITKPASLAEGDIMIAFICSSTAGTGGEAHEGPSGWTKLAESVVSNGSVLTVWGVKATATETAATDFSWTSTGSNDTTIGAILRITTTESFGSIAANVAAIANSALTTTGVTSLSPTTLLLLAGCDETIAGTVVDFSAYSIANNDPTWTEEYNVGNGGGLRSNLGIASAQYPYQQATGNSSVTSDQGTSDVASAIVAISESQNVTVTTTVITSAISVQGVTVAGSANISTSVFSLATSVPSPTVTTEGPEWTNPDKSATASFSNPDKS